MFLMLVMFSNVCVWLAQAVRKNFRTLMNGLFVSPVTRGSPPEVQAIAQLITGKTLNPADSGDTIMTTICGRAYPIVQNLSFVQTPLKVLDLRCTIWLRSVTRMFLSGCKSFSRRAFV